MNGMDLFSGIGGISKALDQWVKPVTYCEIDPYCQAVLLSRMASGDLDNAPIWDDIRTLDGNMLKGIIDIIHGGFPCQDISFSGNGKGLEGSRSGLFFELIRICSEVKSRFVFLENVPAIVSRGGVEVVRQFTLLGYDCRWCTISAYSVGAIHERERWFLLAHANSKPSSEANSIPKPFTIEEEAWLRSARQNRGNCAHSYWKENKCPSFGMDDGLPYELDRAKALGNSVVTQQAKQAFKMLMGIK